MQQPGVFDLDLYRGDTYRWQARLWDDAPGGIPTDLTGYTVAAQIRDKSGGAVVASLTVTITPPNILDFVLPAALWSSVPAAGGVWDVQLVGATGEVRTVLRGKVTVTGDVTVLGGSRRPL